MCIYLTSELIANHIITLDHKLHKNYSIWNAKEHNVNSTRLQTQINITCNIDKYMEEKNSIKNIITCFKLLKLEQCLNIIGFDLLKLQFIGGIMLKNSLHNNVVKKPN